MDTFAVALIKLGLIGSGRRTTCPSARGSGFVAVTDSQHTLTDSQREWRRSPTSRGSTELDTAYGGLVRGDDRLAVADLHDPANGRSVQLWVDEAYRYLMVYPADRVSQPERRRGVTVEPMTCPPNALRSGTDLIELDPGESWQGRWGLRVAGEH